MLFDENLFQPQRPGVNIQFQEKDSLLKSFFSVNFLYSHQLSASLCFAMLRRIFMAISLRPWDIWHEERHDKMWAFKLFT